MNCQKRANGEMEEDAAATPTQHFPQSVVLAALGLFVLCLVYTTSFAGNTTNGGPDPLLPMGASGSFAQGTSTSVAPLTRKEELQQLDLKAGAGLFV